MPNKLFPLQNIPGMYITTLMSGHWNAFCISSLLWVDNSSHKRPIMQKFDVLIVGLVQQVVEQIDDLSVIR